MSLYLDIRPKLSVLRSASVTNIKFVFFFRRAKDGIHWNMYAHRRMTNIILSHVSEAWGLGMPSHPSSLQEDDFNFDADGMLEAFCFFQKC